MSEAAEDQGWRRESNVIFLLQRKAKDCDEKVAKDRRELTEPDIDIAPPDVVARALAEARAKLRGGVA